MMNQPFKVALVMGGILLFHGCAKVPITGRSQMNLVGESQLMAMAATEYGSFLSENPPMPARAPLAPMLTAPVAPELSPSIWSTPSLTAVAPV